MVSWTQIFWQFFLDQDVNFLFLQSGKRYAYKFDFAGLAAATQPQATDASYKYQSDLFMSPYHGAKLSSFMSPHHSMTSSSGEFSSSSSVPSRTSLANTLIRHQSSVLLKSISSPSIRVPIVIDRSLCLSVDCLSRAQKLSNRISNQFFNGSRRRFSTEKCQPAHFDRRSIIVYVIVWGISALRVPFLSFFFRRSELEGSPLGNLYFPACFCLVSLIFRSLLRRARPAPAWHHSLTQSSSAEKLCRRFVRCESERCCRLTWKNRQWSQKRLNTTAEATRWKCRRWKIF